MTKRLLIIAGELSGDRYGALLARQIRAIASVHIIAIGGPMLQAHADEFIDDVTAQSAVGLFERVSGRSAIRRMLNRLNHYLDHSSIDQAVIIDFPHTHFDVAKILSKHQIPIDTYITPNFWIWKDLKKARRIADYSRKIITIVPPEYALYQPISKNALYLGHPIIDICPPSLPRICGPYLNDGTHNPIRIGLFPGSRQAELNLLLRPMLKCAAALARRSSRFAFIIAVPRPEFAGCITSEIRREGVSNVTVCTDGAAQIMSQIDGVICATGTMTLEVILNRLPLVILGALAPLTYFIARHVLRLPMPYAGLPNIIAQRVIAPEFIQYDIRPDRVADALITQLTPDEFDRTQVRYNEFIELIQSGNGLVTSRVAAEIIRE
ncbi:hypothetical protein EBR96_08010 [bacterium]|nr:hypothetical protein [bacterium]